MQKLFQGKVETGFRLKSLMRTGHSYPSINSEKVSHVATCGWMLPLSVADDTYPSIYCGNCRICSYSVFIYPEMTLPRDHSR